MKKFSILLIFLMVSSGLIGCFNEVKEDDVADYEDDTATMIATSYSDKSSDADTGSDQMTTMDEGIETGTEENGVNGTYSKTITGTGGSSIHNYCYEFSDYNTGTGKYTDMTWNGNHNGNWSWSRLSYSFQRTNTLSLSGISTNTVTVNGNGSSSVDIQFSALYYNYDKTYRADYTHTYENVVILNSNPYPLSGKIKFTIDGERTKSTNRKEATGVFSVDAELTFNGTAYPVLVLNSSRTYSVNLTTGEATLQK